MKAFEVLLNDKKLCVGGIGEHAVLTAIVDTAVSSDRDEVGLRVGGLVTSKEEHVQWGERRKLAVGDEVRIKIVEVETVDSPTNTKPADLAAAHDRQKEYIREAARKFGWAITEAEQTSGSN
jgi:hypothetical protein